MRILKFKINPDKTETENGYFRNGENTISIEPMQSEIHSLSLRLVNVNGQELITPIDLNKFRVNGFLRDGIGDFSFMRFNYRTDKEYVLKVILR